MPSSPRASQVDLSITPYYHCISRCVRRAFLCGDDPYTRRSFEHRKDWFIERLRVASEVFSIDVCAYAILSNHFHVILRVDVAKAKTLSDEAVLRRYGRLFPFAARAVRELPDNTRAERVAVLRDRLVDLGWFMRVVNEHVARRANKEDGCSGRFWEGRFRSQPLLDEAALYTCMSYVDLNPVPAGMSETLEGSEYTSVQQRLREFAQRGAESGSAREKRVTEAMVLAPLRGEGRGGGRPCLEIRFADYIELLEWTGRARGAKPGGRIRGVPPRLLGRLHIDAEAWLSAMGGAGLAGLTTFGTPVAIDDEAARRSRRWLKGKGAAVALFGRAS